MIKNHEASTKTFEMQISQLLRQLASQTRGGFNWNVLEQS